MQKSKNILWLIMFTILTVNVGFSQDSTLTDSLLVNQQIIIQNQEKMMDEVIYNDPLLGKKYGVEFNPVSFLLASAVGDEALLIAGTVSSFTASDKAEVAFPFYIKHAENKYKRYSIDAHYRYFLGKYRKGIYISSGLRFTHVEGEEGGHWYSDDDETHFVSDNKFGIAFGIGYRKYGYNGWYWGTSMFGGRYLDAKDLDLRDDWLGDKKIIFDIELLKIGKMF